MYKIVNGTAPQYLLNLLPSTVGSQHPYNLRDNNDLVAPRCRLSVFQSSFIPATVSLWNNQGESIRNSPTFNIFKTRLNNQSNKAPKYLSLGERKYNVIHTQLRHNCSNLNADLFRIKQVPSPLCTCGDFIEDTDHFLLRCVNYAAERNTLFLYIYRMNIFHITLPLLLYGLPEMSNEINSKLFASVQLFIKRTNRFEITSQ